MKKSIDNPVAIILGGTYPHIELINNLKKRNYYTILIDFLNNPPAKEYANEHIIESILDKEQVLQIAKKRNANLVISTCIDQANLTACYVGEKLSLPKPYSYNTALNVTDKIRMKSIMMNNNIPTSKYLIVNDINDLNVGELDYPLIVKPSNSNSSKGVRRIDIENELETFIGEALRLSTNNESIVEEFIEGKEIGADCIIVNHEAKILITRERRKINNYDDPIQQIQGSFWPAKISESEEEELRKIVEGIAKVFNLDNTPFMIQTILKDGKFNVIEFAPRIGGGENYKIIDLHTGINIIDCAIDSFLNNKISISSNSSDKIYADIYLYASSCILGRVNGYEKLIEQGIIEYLNIYKQIGMKVGPEITSNNRIGAFLVKGKNINEVIYKINKAINSINVYDIDGNSVLRNDFYQH